MAIHRGDVYFVDLNPTVGREQAGKRPVVVISNDLINSKPLVVVVIPGTRGSKVKSDYPGNIRVPKGDANLPEETVFLCFKCALSTILAFKNSQLAASAGHLWIY
jgi:mRNA interferase MazF